MEELSWILGAKRKSRLVIVNCLWNCGWVHEMTLRAMFHTELSLFLFQMFALIKIPTQILTLAEVAENVFYCHYSLKKEKKIQIQSAE